MSPTYCHIISHFAFLDYSRYNNLDSWINHHNHWISTSATYSCSQNSNVHERREICHDWVDDDRIAGRAQDEPKTHLENSSSIEKSADISEKDYFERNKIDIDEQINIFQWKKWHFFWNQTYILNAWYFHELNMEISWTTWPTNISINYVFMLSMY